MKLQPRNTPRWALAIACLGLLTGCEPAPAHVITISQPTAAPTLTPAPIRVHMAGAVQNPGVYELEPGSRIIDGIEAAGGLHPDAHSDSINLADYCEDASRIYVPFRGTPTPMPPTPISGALIQEEAGDSQLLNINTASASELEALPGIGPVLAERIVAYRDANGPFATASDILEVSGIGDVTFANLEAHIMTE